MGNKALFHHVWNGFAIPPERNRPIVKGIFTFSFSFSVLQTLGEENLNSYAYPKVRFSAG